MNHLTTDKLNVNSFEKPIIIHDNEIHLSFVWVDKIKCNDLIDFYKSLLSQTETKNYNRFYFLHHRKQYLVTRALIRTNIANYLGIAPKDVNFILNKYGRPEISPEQNLINLRFNLSHTDGLIMCGVTLNNDIGVDVEHINCNNNIDEFAKFALSSSEYEQLQLLHPDHRKRRFLDFWTLKESYIKACGRGLDIPLKDFNIELQIDNFINISFSDKIIDDANDWLLWLLDISEQYIAAVSLKIGTVLDYKIIRKEILPCVNKRPIECPIIRTNIY